MELGSIAFTILCDDADLDRALPKIVNAGYRKAGQVCTSVQILLVHERIMEPVERRLTAMVGALRYGDPYDAETIVGPLISEKEAIRVDGWIAEAVVKGARRLAGGEREGAIIAPTLLTGIDTDMQVGSCEIFGPVICLTPFATLGQAIDRVNATPFGLATGIFTNKLLDALTRGSAPRCRRGSHQRDLLIPRGHDALRRLQGERLRPRRTAIRHPRDDRGAGRDDLDAITRIEPGCCHQAKNQH